MAKLTFIEASALAGRWIKVTDQIMTLVHEKAYDKVPDLVQVADKIEDQLEADGYTLQGMIAKRKSLTRVETPVVKDCRNCTYARRASYDGKGKGVPTYCDRPGGSAEYTSLELGNESFFGKPTCGKTFRFFVQKPVINKARTAWSLFEDLVDAVVSYVYNKVLTPKTK